MLNGFALVQRAPCAKMHSKILRLNMLEWFPINTASTQYSWLLSQVRNSEFSHKQWNKLYKLKPRKPRNKNSEMAWRKKIKIPHMLLAHHTEPLRLTQELFFSKAHGPSFHSQFYFLTMWQRDMKKLARWDMSAPLEELEEAGTGGAITPRSRIQIKEVIRNFPVRGVRNFKVPRPAPIGLCLRLLILTFLDIGGWILGRAWLFWRLWCEFLLNSKSWLFWRLWGEFLANPDFSVDDGVNS